MLLSLIQNLSKELDQKCIDPKMSLDSLIKEILSRVSVKLEGEMNNGLIYISDSKPPPDKKGVIWIKTSEPYGIGIVVNGVWNIDYGLSGRNDGEVFLFNYQLAGGIIPAGVRLLNDTEIEEFGLTDTDGEKEKRLRWAIFAPEKIEV